MPDDQTGIDVGGYLALGELYHRFTTGLVLTVATRRGEDAVAELCFHLFRRQQQEKFLPGLDKLGLRDEPLAVACAKYHYLSNHLGGVKVEFIPESDTKAWVRYLPPRWIFDGTAIAGAPSKASRAFLHAWHGNNGVLLGDERLGFVCTKLTTDGQPGLEGYYQLFDRPLAPEDRVQFRPGEEGPDVDPGALPTLDSAAWPEARLAKAQRNYAMEYVRNSLVVLMERFGPAEGRFLGHVTGRLVGMQVADEVAARLGTSTGTGLEAFTEVLARLLRAQGETAVVDGPGMVRQSTWRLLRGAGPQPLEVFDAWSGLFEGLALLWDRRALVQVGERLDAGDEAFVWRIRARQAATAF